MFKQLEQEEFVSVKSADYINCLSLRQDILGLYKEIKKICGEIKMLPACKVYDNVNIFICKYLQDNLLNLQMMPKTDAQKRIESINNNKQRAVVEESIFYMNGLKEEAIANRRLNDARMIEEQILLLKGTLKPE